MKTNRQNAIAAIAAVLGRPADRHSKHGIAHCAVWDDANAAQIAAVYGAAIPVETWDGQRTPYLRLEWTIEGRIVETNRAGAVLVW